MFVTFLDELILYTDETKRLFSFQIVIILKRLHQRTPVWSVTLIDHQMADGQCLIIQYSGYWLQCHHATYQLHACHLSFIRDILWLKYTIQFFTICKQFSHQDNRVLNNLLTGNKLPICLNVHNYERWVQQTKRYLNSICLFSRNRYRQRAIVYTCGNAAIQGNWQGQRQGPDKMRDNIFFYKVLLFQSSFVEQYHVYGKQNQWRIQVFFSIEELGADDIFGHTVLYTTREPHPLKQQI